MIRQTATSLFVLSFTLLGVAACSGGEIAVGKSNGSTDQALQTKKNGGATGNGTTCSWEDTVAYDVATGTTTTTPSGSGYSVGDNFKSLDGCNDCQCSAQGIMCTQRACNGGGTSPGNPGSSGAVGCSMEAMICPDGKTSVGRSGPNCEFAPCPGGGGQACTEEAKECPDGSYVGRTGPNCEFAECPVQVCPADAMLCPDGKTSVGRTGPNCAFAPCPK